MPLLFLLLWIILNGRVTVEILLFGIAITAAVTYAAYKAVGYTPERDLFFFRNIPLLLAYLAVLLAEIMKSAAALIRYSLDRKRRPDPVIVEFHSGLPGNQLNVLLANSITLTPGTYTLFQEGDHFVVHCLTDSFSEGMENSRFVKLLGKMRI